jgi:hypothetical protein
MTEQYEGGRVLTRFRWRIIALGLTLLATESLLSCQKRQPDKAASQSRAELTRQAEAARGSLARLEPRLAALDAKFVGLRREFDPLPPGLTDFGEIRAKFYSASIGLGTMNAKLPWLAGRIDSASKAGSGAELAAIAKDLERTHEQVRQIETLAAALQEQVRPFKQRAEEKVQALQAQGKLTCE